MKKLEHRVALVTGSARGIGAAIAERLAEEGATVAINYVKSVSDAEAVAARIRAAGGNAKVIKADMSDPAQARALVETVIQEFERLDILVNNAGSAGGFGPIEMIDEAQLRSQFALHVAGPIFALQAAVPHLQKDGGRVINVSSLVATRAMAGTSIYAATKSALDALTRSWAAELGPRGITVNAVAPGAVDTDMLRSTGMSEEAMKHIVARTPLGRIGNPSDIADVVAFLASSEARWVTGQVIETAGGLNP